MVELGFLEQVYDVEVHGCQLPARHALQLCDDEKLTDVLQPGHLVHLGTDQETHGLEDASWATGICVEVLQEGQEGLFGNTINWNQHALGLHVIPIKHGCHHFTTGH